jgi:hypothetical protein
MSDNLDKYLPEFDEDNVRNKLAGFTREQLINTLVYCYKEKRVWAKSLGEQQQKLRRMQEIIAEPSNLLGMPGIPTSDDLRRMIEDNEN